MCSAFVAWLDKTLGNSAIFSFPVWEGWQSHVNTHTRTHYAVHVLEYLCAVCMYVFSSSTLPSSVLTFCYVTFPFSPLLYFCSLLFFSTLFAPLFSFPLLSSSVLSSPFFSSPLLSSHPDSSSLVSSPLFLSSPLLSSSLWYNTVLLASSTPAYVQLRLKGKAELFCLWFVPAGVLSEQRAGTPLPSDHAMQAVYGLPKWWSNYCFWCTGETGAAWRERYSPFAVIVWLQCCLLPHADTLSGGGWGWGVWNTHSHRCLQYKSMHTPRETWAYTQWQKALSALRDYLPVSSTNHFKCPCLRDIVWLYHGTAASSWLCSHFQTFSSFQINFLHQNSFYLPIILFSYYLRCPSGKISVTERRGRREEMSCDGEQSALQLEVQSRGPQTLIGIILILLSCIIGHVEFWKM